MAEIDDYIYIDDSDPLMLFLEALASAPPAPCQGCPSILFCDRHKAACDDYRVYIEYGVNIERDRQPSRAIFQKAELL